MGRSRQSGFIRVLSSASGSFAPANVSLTHHHFEVPLSSFCEGVEKTREETHIRRG